MSGSTNWYLTTEKGELIVVTVPTANSRLSWSVVPNRGTGGEVRIYATPTGNVYDYATGGIREVYSSRVTVDRRGIAPAALVEKAVFEASRKRAKELEVERENRLIDRVTELIVKHHYSEEDAYNIAYGEAPFGVSEEKAEPDEAEVPF